MTRFRDRLVNYLTWLLLASQWNRADRRRAHHYTTRKDHR